MGPDEPIDAPCAGPIHICPPFFGKKPGSVAPYTQERTIKHEITHYGGSIDTGDMADYRRAATI